MYSLQRTYTASRATLCDDLSSLILPHVGQKGLRISTLQHSGRSFVVFSSPRQTTEMSLYIFNNNVKRAPLSDVAAALDWVEGEHHLRSLLSTTYGLQRVVGIISAHVAQPG